MTRIRSGCVVFEVAEGALLGPNRAMLLRRLAQGCSIEKTVAFIGIELSHALELIERMNSAAAEPLIEQSGELGNNVYLTPAGIAALADYDKAFAEWHRLTLMEIQAHRRRDSMCADR